MAASATDITFSPSASTFLAVAEPAFSADGDVLDAGILEVQRMRAALAAIADDGDLLALDEIEIGIAIVIDAHVVFPSVQS